MNSRSDRDEIPPGMLDLMVLRMLARRERLHGFEIAQAIEQGSGDVLLVEEGSLYPALQRLLLKGFVDAEWGRTPDNRRARYYELTAAGRRHHSRQMQTYRRISSAVARVLEPARS
jgi:PadR family transcriptional regulator PadR